MYYVLKNYIVLYNALAHYLAKVAFKKKRINFQNYSKLDNSFGAAVLHIALCLLPFVLIILVNAPAIELLIVAWFQNSEDMRGTCHSAL